MNLTNSLQANYVFYETNQEAKIQNTRLNANKFDKTMSTLRNGSRYNGLK